MLVPKGASRKMLKLSNVVLKGFNVAMSSSMNDVDCAEETVDAAERAGVDGSETPRIVAAAALAAATAAAAMTASCSLSVIDAFRVLLSR